ncbi:hypothetical protein ABW19_dt0206118 [Dactylella cylindrospora]|nr:hypothetical protein ABW19_dt0206118 [Dactylella cylindrospora]
MTMQAQHYKNESYSPRSTAQSVFHLVSKSLVYGVRNVVSAIPNTVSRLRSDYRALPQSPLPRFRRELPVGNRRKLAFLASISVIVIVYLSGFAHYSYSRFAGNQERQDYEWERNDVAMLLGSGYPLGKIISAYEWSTFVFGSKPIPAPPPEPPGTTVNDVIPASGWLNCDAAKDLAQSLPEVTFIALEEALEYGDENEDLSWLDTWISQGRIDLDGPKPQTPVLDVVYTWVNGSSEAFREAKHAVEKTSRLAKIPGYIKDTLNRHQDWDELKYSVRSIERFFERDENGSVRSPNPLGSMTIISTEHSDIVGIPQTPLWLNTSHPDAPEIITQESLITPILEETCALETFSSCSVEARLDRLTSENDKFLSLSDDMLLSNQHSAADIYSPLYGLPFTFEYAWQHFIIDFPPAFGSIEYKHGEYPYLYLSAYLLYVRFGWELRSYNKHTVHSMSRSILRELRSTFPSAFETSSAQRFRGESPSIHLWFLFYWYVIERHRESLLWSYLYGKLQDDETGTIDIDDLRSRLVRIDTSTNFTRTSMLPDAIAESYKNASVEPNRASRALWSSADGPVWLSVEDERDLAKRFDDKLMAKEPFEEPRRLKPCEFMPECYEFTELSAGRVTTDLVFEKWRRTERSCGDCMINALLRESGPTGLGAFLPEEPKKRSIALRALHRYSHTVSRVDARYGMMESVKVVEDLTKEWIDQKPGEVCFNDHFNSEDPAEIAVFAEKAKGFFETYYPGKSKWEL